MITRRQFGKAAVTMAVSAGVASVEGCNAIQWLDIAIADLPTIIQVITAIIAIAENPSVSAPLEAEIKTIAAQITTDLRLAEVLVQSYTYRADASILQQINSVLLDAQTNLSALLAAFHVDNPTLQVTISGVVGLAIASVVALEAIVPAPANASINRKMLAQPNGTNAIKQAFNIILAGHYPTAVLS